MCLLEITHISRIFPGSLHHEEAVSPALGRVSQAGMISVFLALHVSLVFLVLHVSRSLNQLCARVSYICQGSRIVFASFNKIIIATEKVNIYLSTMATRVRS